MAEPFIASPVVPTTKPSNGANGPQVPAEPKPATPPAEAKPKDVNASLFASLAKKEAAWRGKVAAEKAEVAKARAEAEAIRAKNAELEQRIANAKKAPLDFLKAAGLSYEDVTAAQLNDGRPDPSLAVSALRDDLEALRKQQAEREAKAETDGKAAKEAEHKRAMEEFRAGCGAFIKANAGEYRLAAHEPRGGEMVAELIAAQHAKDGKLLTHAEAALKVETFLRDDLKKRQSVLEPEVKAPPQPVGARKSEFSAQSRTLSNDMTISTPALAARPMRTEKERIEAALLALSK